MKLTKNGKKGIRSKMTELCVKCGKETDEVCPDMFCRKCHVSISFDDCCKKNMEAKHYYKDLISFGETEEQAIRDTKRIYPQADFWTKPT